MVGIDPKENKDNAFFLGGGGEGGGGFSPSQNIFNPFTP